MNLRSVRCLQSFFFFQAEDGIRDLTVTGVQTCALPICGKFAPLQRFSTVSVPPPAACPAPRRRAARSGHWPHCQPPDRKSTRLNSSHSQISYAVFCLKKKKKKEKIESLGTQNIKTNRYD